MSRMSGTWSPTLQTSSCSGKTAVAESLNRSGSENLAGRPASFAEAGGGIASALILAPASGPAVAAAAAALPLLPPLFLGSVFLFLFCLLLLLLVPIPLPPPVLLLLLPLVFPSPPCDASSPPRPKLSPRALISELSETTSGAVALRCAGGELGSKPGPSLSNPPKY